MKVILEPTITVVGHSVFVEHPIYKIPPDGSDAIKLGSFAAKGCYDSHGIDGRANEENQLNILEHRHGSVLEHSSVSLFIEGITRALTLELNRHRTFAISQRSTRYTKEEDAAIVLEPYYAELFKKWSPTNQMWSEMGEEPSSLWIIPNELSGEKGNINETEMLLAFLRAAEKSFNHYVFQVDSLIKLNPLGLKGFDLRKWARGKARNILPHCLETRGTWTNNHRGWRWIIECRSEKHAEPEIRRLADHMLKALRSVVPEYYTDFTVSEEYDGIPVWTPQYKKV